MGEKKTAEHWWFTYNDFTDTNFGAVYSSSMTEFDSVSGAHEFSVRDFNKNFKASMDINDVDFIKHVKLWMRGYRQTVFGDGFTLGLFGGYRVLPGKIDLIGIRTKMPRRLKVNYDSVAWLRDIQVSRIGKILEAKGLYIVDANIYTRLLCLFKEVRKRVRMAVRMFLRRGWR